MDEPKTVPTPGPPIPSDRAWFDPALVQRHLYTRLTVVEFSGAAALPAAPLDSSRWAIGFVPGIAGLSTSFAAPWTDIVDFPGWGLTVQPPLWFYLTKHGSIVCDPWYVSAGGPGFVRVVEILRRSKGK